MFWRATVKYNHFKIAMFFVVIISTLSGCVVENPVDEEDNEINPVDEEDNEITDTESDLEVVSYTVETQAIKFDNTFEKIADGFVYSEIAYRYLVRGKVKNNETENISKIRVTVNFYDKEDNLIYSPSDVIFHFETNDIRDFAVDFTKYDDEGFPNADHIGFTFMKE